MWGGGDKKKTEKNREGERGGRLKGLPPGLDARPVGRGGKTLYCKEKIDVSRSQRRRKRNRGTGVRLERRAGLTCGASHIEAKTGLSIERI